MEITRSYKTKLLKEVKKLAYELPPVSSKILNKAAKSTRTTHWGHRDIKTKENTCLHCEHKWTDEKSIPHFTQWGHLDMKVTGKCPHCGSPLVMDYSQHRCDAWFYAVLDEHSGWPVMRILSVERKMSKATGDTFGIAEIYQYWFDGKGNYVVARRQTEMFTGNPNIYSFAEFRVNNLDAMASRIVVQDFGFASAEARRLFARRGFKGGLHNLCVDNIIRLLYTDEKFESLWKIGTRNAFQILRYKYRCSVSMTWWKQIVAYVNSDRHYDLDMWIDHLKVLSLLGKDLHNPHYILPENLKKEHSQMNRMLENRREKERQKEREDADMKMLPEYIKNCTEAFEKAKKRYFGITFENNLLKISTIDSIAGYFEDSRKLHHCMFHNKYWEKPDTLCLRATYKDGHLIANIELDLETNEIRQCYGLQNKIVKENKQIRKLIAANVHLYKAAANRNTTMKAPVIATPVFAIA